MADYREKLAISDFAKVDIDAGIFFCPRHKKNEVSNVFDSASKRQME